ncbi:MAG TPA: FHA domain-containing protein [Dongiaceae bacterium]|nr:FHA domain-containing protein [Dongiaceae bacterium]
MSQDNKDKSIKITLDDLASVAVPQDAPAIPSATAAGKSYGSINAASDPQASVVEEKGSILLQAWFYLGAAGLLGAVAGWGICEPHFIDGGMGQSWGNWLLIPLIVALLCLGFGVAESVVERSVKKALLRGAGCLGLGVAFGFIFMFIANILFGIGIAIIREMGVQSERNPSLWVVRGLAWMVFGAAGGLVYGIVGMSSKKTLYGVLGGVVGAGLGGVLFDPIALLTHGGAASRAVGFGLVGLATGVAVGLVESALKDRWLYVTAGPLAGKQFILYKPRTVIGSEQSCDIYLFKDSNILKEHAIIDVSGPRLMLRAIGDTYLNGQPVRQQVLLSGAVLQIGRYAFRYQERQRN